MDNTMRTMYVVTHIGLKNIMATPMTRGDYNDYRGLALPANERGSDAGYMVEYEPRVGEESNVQGHDGYVSWSPKQVFDDAYHNVQDNLSFGLALELTKQGRSIARRGWNGKGLKITLQVPDAHSKMSLPYLYMSYPSTPASDTAPSNHLNANVPWLASQTDMLANDWYVVEVD
jgi:hypothetical protein